MVCDSVSHKIEIGLQEVVSLAEQGRSGSSGKSVGTAIAKVQCCWVSSLAEALPSLPGQAKMVRSERGDVEHQLIAKGVEDQAAGWPLAGLDDSAGLQKGKGADPPFLRFEDEVKECGLLRLPEQNRNKGRAIENQAARQNRPCSS